MLVIKCSSLLLTVLLSCQVPFRTTHHISGQAVRMAEERGVSMSQLSVEDLKTLHPLFEADVMQVWDFEKSVEQRCSLGGTSKRTVLIQIEEMKKQIGI